MVYCQEFFNQFVAGSGQTAAEIQYSPDSTNRLLASADKLAVQYRITQASGTVTPNLKIDLEHSNDGTTWYLKATLFTGQPNLGGVTTGLVYDVGTNPTGCLARLKVYFSTGTTPQAQVQITVAGRNDG